MSSVIVCNPGHGNGPALRCAEIAMKVAAKLPETPVIVMPLLYGERQKAIFREEYPDMHVVFDETLGKLIRHEGYVKYEVFLERWLGNVDDISHRAANHIAEKYGSDVFQIARAPLLDLHIDGYCSLFARTSDILNQAMDESGIGMDRALLRKAADRMRTLEDHFRIRFITEPGTFAEIHPADIAIPLTTRAPFMKEHIDTPAIFISVSGLGMPAHAVKTDMTIYSNHPESVPGSLKAPPDVLAHDNVVLHVARAGWGAVWNSLLTATPLVVAPYHHEDDPEIFFNIRRIEELGIGLQYRGESVEELLEKTKTMPARMKAYREELKKRFGTLDGAELAAAKITEDRLKANAKA